MVVRKSRSVSKKIPKKIKNMCKKFNIRLTTKKGSKRIKKTMCVLLRELKKKVKGRKNKFGEGEKETKKPGRLKRIGGAIKRNPGKSLLIGGALIGGIALTAVTFGAAGPAVAAGEGALLTGAAGAAGASEAVGAASAALTAANAAKRVGDIAGAAKHAEEAAKLASKGSSALEHAQTALSSAEKASQVIGQIKSVVPIGGEAVNQNIGEVQQNHQKAAEALQENVNTTNTQLNTIQQKANELLVNSVIKPSAFPSPPSGSFGKRRSYFGHSSTIPAQQVFNFGRGRMTKATAMKILRDLYRKNCK